MKKRHIITGKFKKGSLIKYLLESEKREFFEKCKKPLKEILHKKPGIYALYKGDRLVYVGLTTGLYSRMHGWVKSEKFKWDNFSVFIVRNIKYLRDLETIIVRIANPKGNELKGKVPGDRFLGNFLKNWARKIGKDLTKEIKDTKRKLKGMERIKEKGVR